MLEVRLTLLLFCTDKHGPEYCKGQTCSIGHGAGGSSHVNMFRVSQLLLGFTEPREDNWDLLVIRLL